MTKLYSKSMRLLHASLLLLLLFISGSVFASHFRYGNVTWTRVSETSTTVTIRLNVSLAWRLTAAPGSVAFAISGGPTTGSVTVPMSNVTDPSGGWTNSTGSATTTLTKSASLYKLAFNSGNKIAGLANNDQGYWNVFTLVNTNAPGSSPVSTLPAIINMPIGATAATYTIPASDPDAGSTLSYRLATGAEMGGTFPAGVQPAGLLIDAATGQITFNTIGKTINQLWNADVIVTDNDGNQIMLDFLINMVGASTPPVFDYSVTPANGFVYNVIAGQNISFPIKATDADAGSTVKYSVSGLPSYITLANFSPALPATGNPALTTFSWTPAAAQIGSTVILNFIATDNVGVQSSTSVTIRVAAEPAPVFIYPTPGQSSIRQIQTGVFFQDDIVAQSTLGSNVTIAFATVPSGAALSPAVPTTGANPGQTTVSWTPSPANWGLKNLSFQATISNIPTIFSTRSYSIIVNTPPAFTSSPVTTVNAGDPYSYTITVNDPDLPYGDQLNIIASTLPSWLTLTDNHNGTATLSGTPTVANAGSNSVSLEAEDTYHHGNPTAVEQNFTINVIACTPTAVTKNAVVSLDNNGQATLQVSDVDGGSTDNCGIQSIAVFPNSFSCASLGNQTVTLTVTNIYGISSTQTATVFVQDITAPVKPVLADVTGECAATVTAIPTTTDNCKGMVSGTTGDALTYTTQGTYVITWSFDDGNGNVTTATQNVIVKDMTAPAQPLLADVTGECSATATVPTTTDNCAGTVTGTTSDALTYTAQGTYAIHWSFDDGNGNVTTATQNVIVKDMTAPVVKTQPVTIQLNAAGNASVLASQVNAGSYDNCGVKSVSVSPSSFNCSNFGANTVTLTVTDVNGLVSTGTAVVTVEDLIAPVVITKPATITLVNGVATLTADMVNGGSTDACGIASVSIPPSIFHCSDIGNHTVVLTVTDIHGNQSSATATFTVVGEIPACSVKSVPSSNVFTGGNPNSLYLGYGAQSTVLQVTPAAASGNGGPVYTYTYSWSGSAVSKLSSTTSGAPVFTPTAAGLYTFTVVTTNNYGCATTCSISICVSDVRVAGTNGSKVYVCHLPPGNTANRQTLSISVNAVDAHLSNHTGDRLGSCDMQSCGVAVATNSTTGTQVTSQIKSESSVATEEDFKITVIANPTTSYFTLKLESKYTTPVSMRVMDANGRLVDAKSKLNANSTIQIGQNYHTGSYYAELVQGTSRKVVQLIKIN